MKVATSMYHFQLIELQFVLFSAVSVGLKKMKGLCKYE